VARASQEHGNRHVPLALDECRPTASVALSSPARRRANAFSVVGRALVPLQGPHPRALPLRPGLGLRQFPAIDLAADAAIDLGKPGPDHRDVDIRAFHPEDGEVALAVRRVTHPPRNVRR
jgi:hypothetical protein